MASDSTQHSLNSYATGIEDAAVVIGDFRAQINAACEDDCRSTDALQRRLTGFWNHVDDVLAPEGIAWALAPPPDTHKEHFTPELPIIASARAAGFQVQSVIQRFRGREHLGGRPFTTTSEAILMITRSGDYHFTKEPLRTNHVYDDADWGDRTSSRSGYHGGETSRYNEDGRDPGTVWLEEARDSENKPVGFDRCSRPEAIERCVTSCIAAPTAPENPRIHAVGVRGELHATLSNIEGRLSTGRESGYRLPVHVPDGDTPLVTNRYTANSDMASNQATVGTDEQQDDVTGGTSYTLSSEKVDIRFRNSEAVDERDRAKQAQCIVTSPPYWDLKDYGSTDEIGTSDPDYETYLDRLSSVWETCRTVLADDGIMWVVVDDFIGESGVVPLPHHIIQSVETTGLEHVETLIWYKPSAMSGYTDKRPVDKFEYVLGFAEPPCYCSPIGAQKSEADPSQVAPRQGSVIRTPVKRGSIAPDLEHDAAFPTELATELIGVSSREGDLVFDPFLGSGTTAAGAVIADRNALGYELSSEFAEDMRERIPEDLSPEPENSD